MTRVKNRGNKTTEIKLIGLLRNNAIIGWRRSYKIFGKPDFVFPKARLAIFVDGCFWHGCPMHGSAPKTNKVFWKNKLERNIRRDKIVCRKLKALEWKVLRIWQHELNNPEKIISRIKRHIT